MSRWKRLYISRINTCANNVSCGVGPFTLSWDHEFTPYTPGVGFGWLPQPRRAFRVWLDLPFGGKPFRKLLEILLWCDRGHYCECGVYRGFCDLDSHAWRLATALRPEKSA